MLLPKPRGTMSAAVFEHLRSPEPAPGERSPTSPVADSTDDELITLWALQELSYRGFEDTDGDHEGDPFVLAVRHQLESALEARLRSRWTDVELEDDFAEQFFDFVAAHDGPSLAGFILRKADRDQALELMQARSIYQLKEADPTTWVIPHLAGRAKAALVELQYDEYGAGDPDAMHSQVFAAGMEASGLNAEPGHYINDVPAEVLEQNTAMSLFGMQRRLAGAALGHLAGFEASSSLPSQQMAAGLRRLELPDEMAKYYDEHVEADAVHEQLAVRSVCRAFIDDEPHATQDVFFGAFTCLDLEARTAQHFLDRWEATA